MSTFSKILVPVVFSARCADATRYAAALACRFGGELTLLHVFVPPFAAYASPEGYATPPQLEVEAGLARIQTELDEFLCDELRGCRVVREVIDGDPAHAIAEYAQARKCDLIVMPTHGYGTFRRFLLGSVTAKVLHDARCPVFTGPHLEHPPALESPSFHKVLCAIDLGPQSRAVLEWGAWFAREFAADLSVIHALPSGAARLDGIYFDPQWRNDLAAEAHGRIAALEDELHNHAEIRIEGGDVPAVVSDAAETIGADLLVIGRGHLHGLLGRLRTNAYAILRESPCPVVAI
jgi:nucleotide-binding universal stress UspA family protein